MKRELLERGTHIPLIVKYPNAKNAGTVNDNLVSAVDFAPSVLSIAGVTIPAYMQGQAFLGDQKVDYPRKYIYAARDRVSVKYDRVRAVSDGRFKYLYNYMPELPYYQDLNFRKSIPLMKEILAQKENGELNPMMMKWFDTKPVEELYDTQTDPDEFNNLATDSKYADKLNEMRAAFQTWRSITGDMAEKPEKEMIEDWWNGKNEPPITAQPVVYQADAGIKLFCDTEGASIGYQILKKGELIDEKLTHKILSWDFASILGRVGKNGESFESDRPWKVYEPDKPIILEKDEKLVIKARRIGYKESTLTYVEKSEY
ncbi:sulfatase/phosphatase domain-containing protein [Chondrinema litorale]|uniref:sulfatase/phosphatase domain-containing protein n=1 Tax=Chondrinema litorale TaxID=2994555 RepID=UPI002543927F|nr:sulfatase/phosphatase domain-containing protein [Chondrinema litorale]UZR96270.1 hypothetical protein OQ292_21630 [Chondrinema litorale]